MSHIFNFSKIFGQKLYEPPTGRQLILPQISLEFFTVRTKLAEMALLYSRDLTTTKKATSSGAWPDARDYYWFRSPMHVLFRNSVHVPLNFLDLEELRGLSYNQ